MSINAIDTSSLVALAAPSSTTPAAKTDGGGFSDHLLDAVDQARALEQDASSRAGRFADGDTSVGIHEVVIAAEKANVAVRFAVTMKNKVLEAYRELMNTQV